MATGGVTLYSDLMKQCGQTGGSLDRLTNILNRLTLLNLNIGEIEHILTKLDMKCSQLLHCYTILDIMESQLLGQPMRMNTQGPSVNSVTPNVHIETKKSFKKRL